MVQPSGRLEAQPLVAAAADELRNFFDGRDARAAAAQLRLALVVHDFALPLLRAVDDGERLGIDALARPRYEAVDEPCVVGRADAAPLGERVLERQLGRWKDTGVVPEPRKQRAARVRNGS
jgi:hypothetical protein